MSVSVVGGCVSGADDCTSVDVNLKKPRAIIFWLKELATQRPIADCYSNSPNRVIT